jgi:hypothetical protein
MRTNELVRLVEMDVTCRITATDTNIYRGVCIDSGQIYWIENVCTLGRNEWIATVTFRDAYGRSKAQVNIKSFKFWAQTILRPHHQGAIA